VFDVSSDGNLLRGQDVIGNVAHTKYFIVTA